MKHFGDITKINGATVPAVDVITGGSPCQNLSVSGKRAAPGLRPEHTQTHGERTPGILPHPVHLCGQAYDFSEAAVPEVHGNRHGKPLDEKPTQQLARQLTQQLTQLKGVNNEGI